MPGPWISGVLDPGFAATQEVKEGFLLEVGLISDDGEPQGTGLFRALVISPWDKVGDVGIHLLFC